MEKVKENSVDCGLKKDISFFNALAFVRNMSSIRYCRACILFALALFALDLGSLFGFLFSTGYSLTDFEFTSGYLFTGALSLLIFVLYYHELRSKRASLRLECLRFALYQEGNGPDLFDKQKMIDFELLARGIASKKEE